MDIKDKDLDRLARDFEAGWSDDRLEHAHFSWGHGTLELFPKYLSDSLTNQAAKEGRSEMVILQDALTQYLARQPA